jgi:hypothetical protein
VVNLKEPKNGQELQFSKAFEHEFVDVSDRRLLVALFEVSNERREEKERKSLWWKGTLGEVSVYTKGSIGRRGFCDQEFSFSYEAFRPR